MRRRKSTCPMTTQTTRSSTCVSSTWSLGEVKQVTWGSRCHVMTQWGDRLSLNTNKLLVYRTRNLCQLYGRSSLLVTQQVSDVCSPPLPLCPGLCIVPKGTTTSASPASSRVWSLITRRSAAPKTTTPRPKDSTVPRHLRSSTTEQSFQ